MLEKGKALPEMVGEVTFALSSSGKNLAILEPLIAQSGWLLCMRFSISALDTEDHLLLTGMTDKGELLDEIQ